MLDREAMIQVLKVIIDARPKRISLSGGEPLLASWWAEAARELSATGIPVTLFTSGWLIHEETFIKLAEFVSSVAVSVDGTNEQIHDKIRGREGSFRRAMESLEILNWIKQKRSMSSERCYTFGLDYTVTRSGRDNLEDFIEEVTSRFPSMDFVRFGSVVPEGLAQELSFAEKELLTMEELVALSESEMRLASHAKNGVKVSVTDARYFLPNSSLSVASAGIAHIEPDGQLRAFTNYEAKVGNVLHEPLDILWNRALAWRQEPFVVERLNSVRSLADWARVTRDLDRRYGSEEDKVRIAQRSVLI
jgi:MoaA/NifB/PqqE/SkfB family radical SAM enzyme